MMCFSSQNKPIRVLLVDDEVDFTATLAKRLGRHGMDVTTAADGSEAYALLETGVFDVVVLDYRMPGVDGLQSLKAFKHRFHRPEVILLTGHGTMNNAMRAMNHGAFDFLHKPVRFDELTRRIAEAANTIAGQPA